MCSTSARVRVCMAEAKARGYKPGRFSFNVKGGRCEACQGEQGFFTAVPSIRTKMDALMRVGLGYIKVGQQATTLSGSG